MDDYISLKDASILADKSVNTIRNLMQRKEHRGYFKREKRGKRHVYRVSQNFIKNHYNVRQDERSSNTESFNAATVIHILENQLIEKDNQIKQLLERNSELNRIINSMRQDQHKLLTGNIDNAGVHGDYSNESIPESTIGWILKKMRG